MTTVEVETLANFDSVASGGLETYLKTLHRQVVIPEFLKDIDKTVGRVGWRRKTASFSIVAATTNYDCPPDFDKFDVINLLNTDGITMGGELVFIGEDAEKVLAAEFATIAGPPTQYYIVQGSTNALKAIKLQAPPDGSYTAKGIYYRRIPFSDNTSSVDLNDYIEQKHQSGLVKRLRMELLRERFGVDDSRYTALAGEYGNYLEGLEYHKESASRNHAVFVR